MILEQLERNEHFTNVEKQIASYILKNLDKCTYLSVRELGEETYTSKSSVIRFCKKMNFTGYEEFKDKLKLEIIERKRIKLLLEQESINKDTSTDDLFNIIPNYYISTINNVNAILKKGILEKIIYSISHASTVDIYGAGVTYTCATAAKFKFRTLGINCNTYSGINEHYVRSTRDDENRVAIILSFTGGNKAMVEVSKYLKASGVFVVTIAGSQSEKLQQNCDEFIEIPSQESVLSMEVMSPYIAITYIFDLFFAALLIADYDKQVKDAIDVINFRNKLNERTLSNSIFK